MLYSRRPHNLKQGKMRDTHLQLALAKFQVHVLTVLRVSRICVSAQMRFLLFPVANRAGATYCDTLKGFVSRNRKKRRLMLASK
jgi:hypothetical protein